MKFSITLLAHIAIVVNSSTVEPLVILTDEFTDGSG
jgi:hypothetical protein